MENKHASIDLLNYGKSTAASQANLAGISLTVAQVCHAHFPKRALFFVSWITNPVLGTTIDRFVYTIVLISQRLPILVRISAA